MKHKFTVIIESNDKSENREVVKECLKDWIEINCGRDKKDFSWKSVKIK